MTNREKYAEQILDIATTGHSIAVDEKGNFYKCSELKCKDCIFSRDWKNDSDCYKKVKEWSEQEYVEPPVDWSKVPVDTKILVRDSEDEDWRKRHFAKFEDGKIFAWTSGATSFSSENSDSITWWMKAKLAEEDA
jgi:hypothetical protein